MTGIRFVNGDVVHPGGRIAPGVIDVADGQIVGVYEAGQAPASDLNEVDARGLTVAPGFVDLHVNGGGGKTFEEADADGLSEILDVYARHGTTALLGTLNTAPMESRMESLARLQAYQAASDGPVDFLGVYLEGPYYNPEQRGAHREDWMRDPDPEEYGIWLDRFGDLIRVVSLAPEREGALELIEELSRQGIVPAVGHSMATDQEIVRAIEAGLKLVTHLYNAQSTFYRGDSGKHLGVAEMGLMRDELTVEIIPDGHHLTPAMLAFVLKMKAYNRICVITDAMQATGLGPGTYEVMGNPVWVDEYVAYREDWKRHAGSILTMDRAVKNVVEAGVPLGEAIQMATVVPAQTIGVADRKGKLQKGYDADLVLLDRDLEVSATLCRGRFAYVRKGFALE
ncbi:MAG: N-acetylglucosamine-6-phosphate deacetylase [bacterium]|nr:N-acetylglucosamine-6-phosphate deacetylase [bacterium]